MDPQTGQTMSIYGNQFPPWLVSLTQVDLKKIFDPRCLIFFVRTP